jgi:hypothetical protein
MMVQLIASTQTTTGLKVRAELDSNLYPTGIQVCDAQLAEILLQPAFFHGEWNYTIFPRILQ